MVRRITPGMAWAVGLVMTAALALAAGVPHPGAARAMSLAHTVDPSPGQYAAPGPSAVTDGYGNEYVFWRNTDDELTEAYWDIKTAHWYGPITVPSLGRLASEPSAAVAEMEPYPGPGGGTLTTVCVYWMGSKASGHSLFEACDGGASWQGPDNLHIGPLSAAPTASGGVYAKTVAPLQVINVYFDGPGGDIWSTHSDSPGYPASYPPKVAASYGGKGLGPLGSGPSASTDAAASTDDVFWQGTDSGLWGSGYDVKTNSWVSGASHAAWAGSLGSAPSVALQQEPGGTPVIAWEGLYPNGLWWNSFGTARVSQIPGMGPLGSAPSIAWAGQHPGDYYIFWKGRNDYLYEAYYNSSTRSWSRIAFPQMALLG